MTKMIKQLDNLMLKNVNETHTMEIRCEVSTNFDNTIKVMRSNAADAKLNNEKLFKDMFLNSYCVNPIKKIQAFKSLRKYLQKNSSETDRLVKLGLIGILKQGMMTESYVIIFECLNILKTIVNYIIENPVLVVLPHVMALVMQFCESDVHVFNELATHIIQKIRDS